jgi:poly(3-hydroxybutyrate) depolymerase
MIYQAYQSYADMTDPIRFAAKMYSDIFYRPWPGPITETVTTRMTAISDVVSRIGLTHTRPDFKIPNVNVNGRTVDVVEENVLTTPFGTLLHFRKDTNVVQPTVLIIAPLSGHFATLLRATVLTMLRDHDVYITDWHNIRDVSILAGPFDMDCYIDHIIRFMDFLGEDAHLVAVCQPTVGALAASAVMAENGNPNLPRSITLMAGPIDTRINPTSVNVLAKSKPIEWFEKNLIGTVPLRHKGAMRRVYPGFMQISAFVSMNIERHANSFVDLYRHIVNEDIDKAETTRTFYEEYFAMMDLCADFYLQTVRTVFQEHHLPLGTFEYKGRHINPAEIRRSALLTVEGERDDICAIGQTLAAQDLCSSIKPYKKRHHVQTGVGHYGVFSGRRWDNEVYPMVRDFIHLSR